MCIRDRLKNYRPVDGAKPFTGDLVGLVDGEIVIEVSPGVTRAFSRKDVAVVRPLIDFDESDLEDDVPAE